MDVQLYVYDLSHGMARQLSVQFLGPQIDAVYHTSLVFGNVEYFFGMGVQTCHPGTTHHGQPMEKIQLGRTELPIEIILEYLDSLKATYTPESYELFAHNCNNFTHDFSMFLIGRGIPDNITSLPKRVLDTPFGQMLRPQLDSAMRSTTQAPEPTIDPAATNGQSTNEHHTNGDSTAHTSGQMLPQAPDIVNKANGQVYNVTSLQRLDQLLQYARYSSAIIFFTSATCPPCKLVYPLYDELAAQASGKTVLIKVDISRAQGVARRYDVRATPTFVSFLKGKRENTWTGADPSALRGNVNTLMATAFPPHPHELLSLSNFRRQTTKPVIYAKVPPLDKLEARIGSHSRDSGIKTALDFIKKGTSQAQAQETPLPDMPSVIGAIRRISYELPLETRFTIFDILRLSLVDPRVSGYFIVDAEGLKSLRDILDAASSADEPPYSLQLCALQAACNIFSASSSLLLGSTFFKDAELQSAFCHLIAQGLNDTEHITLRVAAASLAFNIASVFMNARVGSRGPNTDESTSQSSHVYAHEMELVVTLSQALEAETASGDVAKLLALALGRLFYLRVMDEETRDLYESMDTEKVVRSKATLVGKNDRVLMGEIASELFGKGLR